MKPIGELFHRLQSVKWELSFYFLNLLFDDDVSIETIYEGESVNSSQMDIKHRTSPF
jgi:hypothetical protein